MEPSGELSWTILWDQEATMITSRLNRKGEGPFAIFEEWTSEADQRAYCDL